MSGKIPRQNRIEVVSRGELEDITKPSSSNTRIGTRGISGPRTSSNAPSASSHRFYSGHSLAPSLEMLSPEEVMDQAYDLELEDLAGSAEVSSEDEYSDTQTEDINTGRTSSIFNIAEPISDQQKQQQMMMLESSDDEDSLAFRQLALFENESEGDYEVESEEERDIIKEIKNEITNQVRQEMKGELAVYKQARENIEQVEAEDPNADIQDLEPKLKEAIVKMRKLDKILEKKIKKEKRVKRDRILLTRKLRDELDELKDRPKKIPTDEKKNTDKFLALALPPSHDKGVEVERHDEEDEPPSTPLFQTQVPDAGRDNVNTDSRTDDMKSANSLNDRDSFATGSSLDGQSDISGTTNGSKGSRARRKKRKDFIKRNKELASDAQNTIAMTDDEKKRLDDLLKDLDALPEIPEEEDLAETSGDLTRQKFIETRSLASVSILDTPNPFQVSIISGEGFVPEVDEAHRLEAIDSRLKMLLPPEDFESIASGSRLDHHESRESILFTKTHRKTVMDIDLDQLGEKILRDTKEERDVKQRLRDIETELDDLSYAVDAEIDSPTLSEAQLNDLLDECARTMSRATEETDSLALSTSRTSNSSRACLLENPPSLPPDVLQELLDDARRSGITPSRPKQITQGSTEDDRMVLESVNEDTIRELLRDSRATSRASSRSTFRAQQETPPPKTQLSRPKDTNIFYQNGDAPDVYAQPKRSFLPEIDPKGNLVHRPEGQKSQRFNNNEDYSGSRPNSGLSSAIVARNSMSTTSIASFRSEDSIVSNGQTPRPPSSERKSSAGRIRTSSSLAKTSFEQYD